MKKKNILCRAGLHTYRWQGPDLVCSKCDQSWADRALEKHPGCPFCFQLKNRKVFYISEYCVAFLDKYPVAQGHTIVIPRRHVRSIFDLMPQELEDLWSLVGKVRKRLLKLYRPDGFNVGVNDGEAAGQTVSHGHIHVIPRFKDDVDDPRGGIRWVIPDKAIYWE